MNPLRKALNLLEKKAESDVEGVTEDGQGNIVIEFKRLGPGKFSNNVDEFVSTTSLDGGAIEELGESAGFGYYALLTFDPPVIVHQGGSNGEWNFASAILNEDSQGFVDVATYDTVEEAKEQWSLIESDYDKFMEDVDSEMVEEDLDEDLEDL